RARAAFDHGDAAALELAGLDHQVEAPRRYVDTDAVAFLNQRDGAALRRLGRYVPEAQPRCAAAETAIGDQCTRFAELLRFQIRGRVQHLLHTRSALRSLVTNDHDVALLDAVVEDGGASILLRFEDPGRPFEAPDRRIHAGGLHDAAVLRQVAVQH